MFLPNGMIIGSKKFVGKIRSTYLPEKLHKEIPQQRDLAKGGDPVAKLKDVFLGQPYRKVDKAENGAGP